MRLRLAVSRVFVCLLALVAWAQSTGARTGTLAGTVRDAGGTTIRDVVVTITGPAPSAQTRTGRTDARGIFTLANLPPGTYRLELARGGFKRHVREAIDVTAGATRSLAIQLLKGATSEVVNDPADAAQSTTAEEKKVGSSPAATAAPVQGGGRGAAAGSLERGVAGGVPAGSPLAAPGVVVGFTSGVSAPVADTFAPGGRAYPGQESYASIGENPFRAVSDDRSRRFPSTRIPRLTPTCVAS
jgi:hypothetical protein